MKDRLYKVDYVWNPSTCACECDKDCEIDEYLKNSTCVKYHFNEKATHKMDYYIFLTFLLLLTVCLYLLHKATI